MKQDPCEVILIAGFLGSGKTTLLRNMLQWPGDVSKTAILVNEFGQIGIDGELFQGFQTPVYELTNGCICCTLQGDFHSVLVEILDGFHLFIGSLSIDIYRVKDFALLEDKRFFLNHVGGKTEWLELDEVGPTKLAFVGWQVNEKETLRALKVCLKL
jgi:hypothetical protein